MCPAPHAVRLSPDERRAYIACWSDERGRREAGPARLPGDAVKVASNAGSAVAPQHQPYALTVSPTSGGVWVSSLASRSVQYLDPGTSRWIRDRTVRAEWLADVR